MKDQCTEERFLRDVAEHQMTVIRDDGINRHIRFRKPGTSVFGFDLITWPGYLCYCGDMGTYVFRRLDDMFQFFRANRKLMRPAEETALEINPGYWGEKLESMSRFGEGFQQFSMDKFKKAVKDEFDRLTEDDEDWTDDERALLWKDIECNVSSAEDEYEAVAAIRNFSHPGAEDVFIDFWECNLKEYTFHYIWCCYALAWGVQKYDDTKIAMEQSGVDTLGAGVC